jgi:hypothetical protein
VLSLLLAVPVLTVAAPPDAALAATKPAVTKLSTKSGPTTGGTKVTITGKHFTKVTGVFFGTTPGTGLKVTSATRLRVTTPAHAAGAVHVRVVTKSGKSTKVRADRFRFEAWVRTTMPWPSDAAYAPSVRQSACWADQQCAVAGTYTQASGNHEAVLWTLAGTKWSVVRAPVPGDAATNSQAFPLQLACGTTGVCAASAAYRAHRDGSDVAADLLWGRSGGTWAVVSPPVPAGGDPGTADIEGLACGGAVCAAHGFYDGPSGRTPALWSFEEGAWAAVPLPVPADAVRPDLADVVGIACGDDGACAASGLYLATPGVQSRRALWQLSAAGWSVHAASTADGKGYAETTDFPVACGVDGQCFAGLEVEVSPGVRRTDVWTLADGTWELTTLPLPGDAESATSDRVAEIACSAAGSCVAVGQYDDQAGDQRGALWVRSAAGSWSVTRAPLPDDAAQNPDPTIRQLACDRGGACFAVGDYVYHQGGADVDQFGAFDRLRWTYANGAWSLTRLFAGTAPTHEQMSTACGSGFCVLGGLGTVWTLTGVTWRVSPLDAPSNVLGLVVAPGGGLALGTYTDPSAATVDGAWVYVG